MERVQTMNPFARRDSHDKASIIIYRVLTLTTWLLVLLLSIVFSVRAFAPSNAKTIWDQNDAVPTPFSLAPRITTYYGALILLLQIRYIFFLNTRDEDLVNAAASVGSHFIVNNVMISAWLLLWVYGWFWIGEIPLILNFFNLTALYFRHRRAPGFVHVPVVSGPLTFTVFAILWNGAAMVNAGTAAARVLANTAIWGILLYALFFVVAFKDYAIGWGMTVLLLALATQQRRIHVIPLQWIFAYVIMALLLLTTLAFWAPPIFCGKELVFVRIEDDDEDDEESESRPLLDDE